MAIDDIAAQFVVTGRVQGVFFRASTQAQAERLGLRGYAGNRSDGGVDVLVAGAADAVETLASWLRTGPAMAKVESVERNAADPADAPRDFEVR